jgi:hypothetical protein
MTQGSMVHSSIRGVLPFGLRRPGKFHGKVTRSCRGYVVMLSAHQRI